MRIPQQTGGRAVNGARFHLSLHFLSRLFIHLICTNLAESITGTRSAVKPVVAVLIGL